MFSQFQEIHPVGLGPNGVKPFSKNVELTDSVSHLNNNTPTKTILLCFCSVWPCWFPYAVRWQRLLVLILMACPWHVGERWQSAKKNVICILGVNIKIDRSIFNIHHMPSPFDFIPTGLHARCWQCSQSLCSRHWWRCPCLNASMVSALVGLIMGWNDHAKSVCDRIFQDHGETNAQFYMSDCMVKQMHNSICRIACIRENCDHGAIHLSIYKV